MKLIRRFEAPESGDVRTFRNSPVAPLTLGASCLALSAAWLLYVYVSGASSLTVVPALVGSMIGALCILAGLNAMRSSGWTLKDAPDGLYLNLRSYLNHHLPGDDPTVLHLAADDILLIVPVYQNVQIPLRDGGVMRTTLAHLDVHLRRPADASLGDTLRSERTRDRRGEPGRRRLSHDYPVRLAAPDRVRVAWRIRPAVEHAADRLSDRYPVSEMQRVKLPSLEGMDEAAREALIREFWEFGERAIAVRMARQHLDSSRATAEGWVQALDS